MYHYIHVIISSAKPAPKVDKITPPPKTEVKKRPAPVDNSSAKKKKTDSEYCKLLFVYFPVLFFSQIPTDCASVRRIIRLLLSEQTNISAKTMGCISLTL